MITGEETEELTRREQVNKAWGQRMAWESICELDAYIAVLEHHEAESPLHLLTQEEARDSTVYDDNRLKYGIAPPAKFTPIVKDEPREGRLFSKAANEHRRQEMINLNTRKYTDAKKEVAELERQYKKVEQQHEKDRLEMSDRVKGLGSLEVRLQLRRQEIRERKERKALKIIAKTRPQIARERRILALKNAAVFMEIL